MINAAALNAEFGAYYLGDKNKANLSRLRSKIYYGAETDGFFTAINTDSTLWEMALGAQGRVLQPFQKQWSPTGDITFTPSPIRLRAGKVDVEFYPDEIVDTWLGFLASESLDRKTWPFVRYYVEEFILKQMNEDWELNEVYGGVYTAPPTAGTAGAAGTMIDGIKKLINDAYTSNAIPVANQLTTGALSTDPATFVGQISKFVSDTPERYRTNAPMKLAMGSQYKMRYLQGVRALYNTNYDQIKAGEKMKVVDAENVSIHFLPSMGSDEKLIMTTTNNAIMPVKNMVNLGRVRITDNGDRLVKVFTDWWKGIGFVNYGEVFTNDRDLI